MRFQILVLLTLVSSTAFAVDYIEKGECNGSSDVQYIRKDGTAEDVKREVYKYIIVRKATVLNSNTTLFETTGESYLNGELQMKYTAKRTTVSSKENGLDIEESETESTGVYENKNIPSRTEKSTTREEFKAEGYDARRLVKFVRNGKEEPFNGGDIEYRYGNVTKRVSYEPKQETVLPDGDKIIDTNMQNVCVFTRQD